MIEVRKEIWLKVMQGVIDKFLKPKFESLRLDASGEWLASVEPKSEGASGEIWGRDYTEYLVRGRGPNSSQDPESIRRWAVWAGSTFIKDWARAKGVSAPPIAIAYKIAREGTTHYPEGTDLLEVLDSYDCLSYVYKELGVEIRAQAILEINRTAKKIFSHA